MNKCPCCGISFPQDRPIKTIKLCDVPDGYYILPRPNGMSDTAWQRICKAYNLEKIVD